MRVTDGGSFPIGLLLMFFVVSMVGIPQIANLAYLVLEMNGFDFGIFKLGV